MEKRFSVLLCTAVLIGAMSTVSAMSIDNYATTGSESIASGETWDISGTLTNVDGTIDNDGSIIANAIESSTSITGDGSLQVGSGNSTLSGTVSQGIVNVTGGNLNNSASLNASTKLTNNGNIINTSSIVAAAIDNKASITGAGTLSASGSNSGTINQSSITLNGNLTNTNKIETGILSTATNKLTNNSNLKVTSSTSGTVDGTGSMEIAGNNSANITQNSVTVTGNLTNTGSIKGNTITNNAVLTNNNVIGDTTSNITNNGTIVNNKTLTANSITNGAGKTITNKDTMSSNTLSNSGTITNDKNLTVSNGLTNNAGAKIEGTGNLSISGTNTNSGNITQNNITINDTLNNSGNVTVNGTFTNNAQITGGGNLNINAGGSSNASIEQNNVSIKGNFNNGAQLEASGKLTNSGTINNTSNIIAAELDNKSVIKGSGNLTVSGGSNTGTITQNNVSVDGTLNNTGSITANTNLTNNGTINNNLGGNIIAEAIENTSTIQGDGNITIKGGSNTGSIIQNAVNLENSFTNDGSLTANGVFTNEALISGNGNLNINAGGSSNASIEQNNVSVNGNFVNNSDLIVTESFTNNGNISGTGNLTVAGGSNSGNINQSSVTLTGSFTNNENKTIETGTLNTNSNALTNNGSLKVSTTTDGTINGKGSMEIGGTNNAVINQSTVNIIGNLDNQGSIIAAAIENKTGVTLNNNGTLGDNNSVITNNGILNNNESVVANSIINKGTFDNKLGSSVIAGSINNQSSFTNNGSVTTDTITNSNSFTGDNGSLIINNGGSNSGTIEQNDIKINAGTLNNTGSIISKNNFDNKGTIIGNTGSLTINNGSSTGSITQNNVTISGSFDNGAKLETKGTLSNTGTINNTNEIIAAVINNTADIKGSGNITISGGTNTGKIEQSDVKLNNNLVNSGTITSSGTFTNSSVITGEGTLNINNGSSTGSITQDNVNISGHFTNSAALNVKELLKNDGTITNNNVITAVINNTAGSVIDGANGKINISGGSINAGNITQSVVNITSGTLDNTGVIIAGTLNNDGSITDTKNTSNITINTTGTNNGSINQNTITNNGTLTNNQTIKTETFNNNKTLINNGAGSKLETVNLINKGTVEMSNGSTITVTAQQDVLGGTINVNGDTNILSVNGADIESTINIGNKSPLTTLKTISGIINETAKVSIANTSTLNIAGADVTLNSNDSWIGSVTLDSGSLVVDNVGSNGQLIATAGNLTLAENGGVLNIGSGSSIADAVVTNIQENSTLNIQNGGKVELNAGDTWNGKIILGTAGPTEVEDLDNIPANATILDVKGLDQTGTLLANNGVLLLGDKDLDIQGESYIEKAVAMELGGNIKVSNGGKVAIDDNDKMTGSAPTVTLSEGGTLNYGKTVDSGLIIKADAGNLNLLAGSNLTFKEGSIADAVAIDIQKDANLKLEGSTLNLDSADQWNGNIINNGGTINANHLTKSSDTATLTQSTGNLNLYNDSNLILGTESSISGGNISITKGDDGTTGSVLTVYGDGEHEVISGGNMTIDEYSKFVLGSGKFTLDTLSATAIQNPDGTIQAALVDVMNGEISESKIGSIVLATGDGKINQANFNIDVLARSNKKKDNDTFRINSISEDATVYINQWGLGGDVYGWDAPIDRHIKLKDIFLDEDGNALLNNIEVTKDTTFTPIGWYQLNKNEEYENIIDPSTGLPMIDPATGMIMKNHVGSNYTLDLVKYNPQVFRGQVATVAQWMNQLNISDMLFTHSMVLPSFKEEDGGMMANRYAAESPLFAPYQYSRKDGGLWYKMYGTFENLQMNNNLGRVGNNAYGALIGADFGLKELKNGWKFMPTAYVGYNGAHQTFAHMGQYQNGGQAGFLGTWYKDNVILGALAYGGIYDNAMDVHGFSDNTFNYFAGAATKAAYNIRLHKDWVLQPNLFVSYNYFGQQNWHSKFGQMGMMAGDLNGVNIAPGLNLIWEKDTFSAYGTLQYMYNINGACGGRAGNVGLPQVEMERGYIQYGLGINKRFTDRASGYLQAVLRNVGRTGVGFQAGFNFMIGK